MGRRKYRIGPGLAPAADAGPLVRAYRDAPTPPQSASPEGEPGFASPSGGGGPGGIGGGVLGLFPRPSTHKAVDPLTGIVDDLEQGLVQDGIVFRQGIVGQVGQLTLGLDVGGQGVGQLGL